MTIKPNLTPGADSGVAPDSPAPAVSIEPIKREVPGEAAYRVTAALVVIRCAPDGSYHHFYRGALVPSTADPEQLEMLLNSRMIELL